MLNQVLCEIQKLLPPSTLTAEMTTRNKKAPYDHPDENATSQEKASYQKWYSAYQDEITWEDFKANGFKTTAVKTKTSKKKIEEILNTTRFSFLPKDIARTSPFFPLSKAKKTEREVFTDVIVGNKWGTITITGPKLSITDEGVLLAVIFLAKKYRCERFKSTYSEMCEIIGTSRGKNPYDLIRAALDRLASSIVAAKVFDKKDLEKKEVEFSVSGAIISSVFQKPKLTEFEVVLNPYFLALYGSNMTTGIDLEKRSKMKGDIAKALYRFLESHKGGGVPFGLLTLCHAINMNTEQPVAELRKLIRKALEELKKSKVINDWKLDKTDNVTIFK
jgi:hypothetical protein